MGENNYFKKRDYLLVLDEIDLRRAKATDNFNEIAELIYETDPYIYPFWFKGNIEEAKKVLSENISKPGFIYNYNNLYIAYDKTIGHIVGLLCAIDETTDLEFDYSELSNVNENYKITVEKYIKVLIKEVEEKKYMYIVNLCVNKNFRSKRIGTVLFGNFLKLMESSGFETFGFDCLLHNIRAKNLYHSLGFKEMYTGIGFDGTEEPKEPEIVFFKRKKRNSLLSEFKFDDSLLKQNNE